MKTLFILLFTAALGSCFSQTPFATARLARDTFNPVQHPVGRLTSERHLELLISEHVLSKSLRRALPYLASVEKVEKQLVGQNYFLIFHAYRRQVTGGKYLIVVQLLPDSQGYYYIQSGYTTCDGSNSCSNCSFGADGCVCTSGGSCTGLRTLEQLVLSKVGMEVD